MSNGLTTNELQRVNALLLRAPTTLEEGVFGAMWSEHCSYKSSRIHLRKLPKNSPRVLVGPGENAGAVDIGDGLCVVFKVESHNHPSFIEPFQGAATGVGGILRDIFTMGARPIATMNLLRFGSEGHKKTAQLVEGATRGLSSYGNCFGVANVASDVAFDACYDANILVNAFAIGLCRHEELQSGVAKGVGNVVIYVGAKTGRDGIHGATMASESFDDNSHERRPTVQVGDPFKEKLLLEACLECFQRGLVVGIQDMGAAGLTSSSYEMATRGESGINLHLDRVPLRDAKMTPYEIMLSESQERMLIVAKREKAASIKEIFTRFGLDAVEIGEVSNGKNVDLYWDNACISSLNPLWLTDEAPLEKRESRRPMQTSQQYSNTQMAGEKIEACLKSVFANREHATHLEQYDRHIGLGTLLSSEQSDAALIRILGTKKAVAMTIGCDEKLCAIDPCEGVKRTFARQVLQLACVGAHPIGVTDCLNFGSPEDAEVMWQFEQTIEGLCEAATSFEVPIVSGNVSLYNQTNDKSIYPTPTLCIVGLRDEVNCQATRSFKRVDDVMYFVGHRSDNLTMAEDWLSLGRMQPGKLEPWNLLSVKKLSQIIAAWVNRGLVDTICTVGDGGIAGTLMRMSGEITGQTSLVDFYSEGSVGVIVSLPKGKCSLLDECKDDFEVLELGCTRE